MQPGTYPLALASSGVSKQIRFDSLIDSAQRVLGWWYLSDFLDPTQWQVVGSIGVGDVVVGEVLGVAPLVGTGASSIPRLGWVILTPEVLVMSG